MFGYISFAQSEFELDLKSFLQPRRNIIEENHRYHHKASPASCLSSSFSQSIFVTIFQQSLPFANVGTKQIDLAVTSSASSSVLDAGSSNRNVARVRPFLLLNHHQPSGILFFLRGNESKSKLTIRKLEYDTSKYDFIYP